MDTIGSNPHEYDTWRVPAYNISGNTRVLLSQIGLDPDPDFPHNFARRALWCADGSSALLQCENRSFQLVHMNFTLNHTRTLCQPSPIVDFLWYPCASRHNPATYCFIASVRECPVKLLDGNDGRLRASYPIVDHRERQIAPHSLLFNPAADKLYCGFQDAIEIFDIHRPGRESDCALPSYWTSLPLTGIVSSLSCSTTGTFFAAGTLTSASPVADNIAFSCSALLMNIGCMLPLGGVLAWAWDLRNASVPVCRFESKEETSESGDFNNATNVLRYNPTNQKIHFDIERGGRWMSRGDQKGNIAIYDLHANQQSSESTTDKNGPVNAIHPIQEFNAHSDAVGSVSFHPLQPVLLSVSGSRHFDARGHAYPDSDSAVTSDEGDGEEEQHWQRPRGVIERPRTRPQPTVRDALVKLWDLGFENTSS
ncbi:hypothetical protein EDD15DRAFT_2350907 [Pisolithus albus]|nr:hypothetical protein EDD15DRAFT_2350907 [Pisolithus albus]